MVDLVIGAYLQQLYFGLFRGRHQSKGLRAFLAEAKLMAKEARIQAVNK